MTADLDADATGLVQRAAAAYAAAVPEHVADDGLFGPPGLDEDKTGIWRDIRDAAIALLPDRAREMYGYSPPRPLTSGRRTEIRRSSGVLDAVLLGEPGVLEARQRIALRMRTAPRP